MALQEGQTPSRLADMNDYVAPGAAIAAPVTTGVVTPANAAYTVADQTALANAVLSLTTTVNALRAALTAHNITG